MPAHHHGDRGVLRWPRGAPAAPAPSPAPAPAPAPDEACVERFCVGPWHVNPAAREICNGTQTHRLSPRALAVLTSLAKAKGQVVERAALMSAVWPNVHVGEESLTQAVAELRRALGDRRGEGDLVLTVPKRGYRLAVAAAALPPASPRTESADANAKANAGADADADADAGDVPLHVHVQVLEARQMEQLHGYEAAGTIKALMDDAAAAAPGSAAVQADYAILVGCTILHRGDRAARLEAALSAAERAVMLAPHLVRAHRAQGFIAGAMGRARDCKRAFERALTLEPADAETHTLAAQAFFGLGCPDAALVLAERATALCADDFIPPYIAARAALAMGERTRAQTAARRAQLRAETRLDIDPLLARAACVRGAALAMQGAIDAARDAIAPSEAAPPHFCALIAHAEAGERARAADVLEALVEDGWRGAGWLLGDPVHRALSDEPRYHRLYRHFATDGGRA